MRILSTYLLVFCCIPWAFSQAGHIMQGVGSVNMSMGGAATGQPLDISGAMQWNPASITAFDQDELRFDIGLFFSSPELSSSVTDPGSGATFSGTTEDDRGVSPLPALAYKVGSETRHHFGFSAFGISGFGVTFPESSTNPINFPQNQRGFGRVESNYSLFQVGVAYAYELSDKFSVGVQPTFNIGSLDLTPNPTANPSQTAGYPSTDGASSAFGFGAQVGVFFDSGKGFKAGASYKTTQTFGDFEFENVYLDGTTGTNEFNLDYPAIWSFGLGYSLGNVDLALDYRLVDYENTDGFEASGWTQTGSVAGFGWENINIISAGIQYKGINRLPLRVGYTYSSNPIQEQLAFFSVPATAIIKNAFQFGLGYELSDRFTIDGVFHYGSSGDATSGPILDPTQAQNFPPLGALPGSEVSYDMTTSMLMFGAKYSW
ncbi:OmpP1/FadL family transporter [Robiginitalea sediminis]|uniref:OmpP1/FadL family transporter n=1 Tax=Robiginitalea sediminis TaxID=1982593 RepID=UPI000B4A663C|nr:outer membrane protein transport protein [Robiginitalea sediminis]